jgi:hypothetical protein
LRPMAIGRVCPISGKVIYPMNKPDDVGKRFPSL